MMGHLVHSPFGELKIALPYALGACEELKKWGRFVLGEVDSPPRKLLAQWIYFNPPLLVEVEVDVGTHETYWVLKFIRCRPWTPEYRSVETTWTNWETTYINVGSILPSDALLTLDVPLKASAPWMEAEMRVEASGPPARGRIEKLTWLLDERGNIIPADPLR